MSSPTAAKRHILIVDDDQLLLAFLGEVVRQAGYETTEASSAEEALRQIAVREPDLALLDIHMSGMSGLELAKRLHAETTVPFMFLSGSGDADSGKQAASRSEERRVGKECPV